jgi:hypothetical protein
MAKKIRTITHSDVLTDDDHRIWVAVRQQRSRYGGARQPSIEAAATQLGLTVDHVTERINVARTALRDAGVIPTITFWVNRNTLGHWTYGTGPVGSHRHRAATANPDTLTFPSERYAYNATCALTLLDLFDTGARATIAATIRDAAATAETITEPEHHIASVLGTVTGRTPDGVTVGTFPNSVGIMFLKHPARPWIMPPAHAHWIANCLIAGAVTSTNTTHN